MAPNVNRIERPEFFMKNLVFFFYLDRIYRIFRILFSPFPRSAGQAAERGKTKFADAEVFTTLQTIPPDFLVFVLAESEIVISRFRPRFQRDRLETEKAKDPINPVQC